MWESVNVKDLYFVGGSMRTNDLYSASGFVHGFRCNITALASYIAERHHMQPLQPVFECQLDLQNPEKSFKALTTFCVQMVSQSATLFEQFNFFCSTITLEKEIGELSTTDGMNKYRARLYPPLPRAYAQERWRSDLSLCGRVEIVFQYGFDKFGKDIPTQYFTHAMDHFHTQESAYIHPVFYAYHHSNDSGSSKTEDDDDYVEEWHLQESLVARWDKDDYVDESTNVDQYTNTVFNALAAALGMSERKDISPVYAAYVNQAYPLMTPQEIEDAFQREPYLRLFAKASDTKKVVKPLMQ